MSVGTAISPSLPPQAAAAADDLDAVKKKHAHAGVAMAVATFAMAATSGIQAVLYLNSFGVDERTDGFFVAFALYASFGVFSQSIRVTSAPMLVGDKPRMTTRELAAALALVALPVLLATVVLAGPLASVLAPGLTNTGQGVAQDALPVLGIAMVLQLWAAGGATVLAVRDRFDRVAVAYIVGALVGLASYFPAAEAFGELALGWSMMAMAIATCGLMLFGVHESRPARPARVAIDLRRLTHCASLVLGRTLIYLSFNALYLVTLASVSGFDAGDATVLSYAYLFASYLVAGTGFALGMSRIADMRRGALGNGSWIVVETVPPGFRYAMLLVAPAMAALVAGGATIAGTVFADSFSPEQIDKLRVFGALLAVWAVAALLVNLLLPALFALDRARFVNLLALPLIALHVAATAVGQALFGDVGTVGALVVAPAAFATVLLLVGAGQDSRRLARELAADGLRFGLLAVVCFGVGAAAGATTSGFASGAIAVVVGSVLYILLTSRFAPREIRLLMGAVRPASA